MMILAIESSAKPVSVAVCEITEQPKLLGQHFQNNGFSHSRTLLSITETLLDNLEMSLSDIDLISVASGPGSFTGVRIGVSAAKGLAWGLDIKVCGVSTLEAMAHQTQIANTIICPVMDARREQVYNALFKWQDGKLIRLCEDRAISLNDLSKELQARTSTPIMLVGDGIAVSNDFLSSKGVVCTLPSDLMHYQTAYGVALASVNSKHITSSELEPFYLRPSQAERELSQSSSI